MFWPGAIARIARCNPDTRRVALLRQPSGRAFSHRRMVVARGNGTLPFADAVGAGRSRLLDHADATSFRRFSYVERGFHAGLIETIFAHFPSEQVLCPLTENLRDRHEATAATGHRLPAGAAVRSRSIASARLAHRTPRSAAKVGPRDQGSAKRDVWGGHPADERAHRPLARPLDRPHRLMPRRAPCVRPPD